MKDAQDAVKEIREWPKLDVEYLVEHEDGDIQFTSEYPGRVVCTKREFMDAKIEQNPTMADAVKALDGDIRRARIADNHGGLKYSDLVVFKVGGPDRWRVVGSAIARLAKMVVVGTVEDFENEAKRMGYKSDRDRWVEEARKHVRAHMWANNEVIEALYNALKSGELPMPEK